MKRHKIVASAALLVLLALVGSVLIFGGTAEDVSSTETSAGEERESTTTNPEGVPDDGSVEVEDADGELRSLPLVADDGTILIGDTTSDPRTPPSYAEAKAKGPLTSWADLVKLMGDKSWYTQGVDARKSKTGFGWSDVQKWATTEGIDPRVIHVFNLDTPDDQVRKDMVSVVGEEAAARLPIARHGCIANTRGFGREKMQDFMDCRKMIRVSLAPIVFDDKGEPVALRSEAGVFVDCFNLFWIPKKVVSSAPTPPPPGAPPRQPPTVTVPPTTPPTTASTTTVPGSSTTTTTTVPPCESGKCTPATTVAPPPTTAAPPPTAPTTLPPNDSGPGWYNTIPLPEVPTTVAPPAPPPPTVAPPTSRVEV